METLVLQKKTPGSVPGKPKIELSFHEREKGKRRLKDGLVAFWKAEGKQRKAPLSLTQTLE